MKILRAMAIRRSVWAIRGICRSIAVRNVGKREELVFSASRNKVVDGFNLISGLESPSHMALPVTLGTGYKTLPPVRA